MNGRLLAAWLGAALLSACAYVDGPNGRYLHVDVPMHSVRTEHKTVHITAQPGTTVIYGESVPPVHYVHDPYPYYHPRAPYHPYRHHTMPHGLIRTQTGQCLDIDQSSANRRLVTYPCHGRSNQQFVFDGSRITANGLCLDVAGDNRHPGAEVIAYACQGRANQAWYYDGRYIRNAMNGLCLDAGKTGNWVRMQRCDGSPGQQFVY